MKSILNSFAIILIALFIFSCNNDNDDTTSPTPSNSFLRYKIDGVAYEAPVAGKEFEYVMPINVVLALLLI